MVTQGHDCFSALKAENAELRSRLQACEQSYAVLQAEVVKMRRQQANTVGAEVISDKPSELEQAEHTRYAQLIRANVTLKKTLDVLATDADLDRALGHVLQVTSEQLGAASSAFWRYNLETERFALYLVYLYGEVITATPENAPRLSGQWIRGQDLSRDLAFKQHVRDRIPVIYDLAHHPEVRPAHRRFMERLGIKTLLGVPLLLGSEVVGSFTIRFSEHRNFLPAELELVQALSHQATLAMRLTQLAEEAKQTVLFEERNRIASDIHDTLAQTFTGISLQLEVAKQLVYQQPKTVEKILQDISQLTKNGLAEARRSVWALYPPGEEYANLAQMLYDSVEQMSRNTTTKVAVTILGEPCPLSPYIGMNLLRVGQEALTNALKHSQAQNVLIALTYTTDLVLLSIRDDGRGFLPPPNLDNLNGGFGLVGMYERCDRIGAQLSILSQPGQGTQILVESPLH